MDKFVIMGGKKLEGEVTISGAKNSAVAIIAASILVEGPCIIENVPDIQDVKVICEILSHLGADVKHLDAHTLEINCEKLNSYAAPYELVSKMRASYYIIGALLGRFSKAEVPMPGGCNFGTRPIDQHIRGFEALGAEVNINRGTIEANAEHLKGTSIYMDIVSVGATINIMIAAARADGVTIIENAAREPHVVDLANFLNSMGASIRGAGTDIIKIRGVKNLWGGTFSIIPDQIEAGTFMIAAAATGGDVLIKNIIPKHLDCISAKLEEMNVDIEEYDDSVRVRRTKELKRANVKTLPYPGFPTDLQPQISTLLSVAKGTSIVTESVWDNRFQYTDELKRLGAKVSVDGKIAVIEGVEKLSGCPVVATDLRAGAAMVIAALMANGVTEISQLRHIDRGYENFEQKLLDLGAQIVRVTTDEKETDENIGQAL